MLMLSESEAHSLRYSDPLINEVHVVMYSTNPRCTLQKALELSLLVSVSKLDGRSQSRLLRSAVSVGVETFFFLFISHICNISSYWVYTKGKKTPLFVPEYQNDVMFIPPIPKLETKS